jgi:hypothetical protein
VSTFIERFWALADQPATGCWTWRGSIGDEGYGNFWLCGKVLKAHRLAYELAVGAVGRGLLVCHHCDNPACVRPDHLFLGSVLANNIDKMTKGRHRALRGAEHPSSIVTPTIARVVLTAAGSQRAIAERFGISRTVVGRIKRGEHWAITP